MCEEQDKQLEILKTGNDKITSERDSLSKERDGLSLKTVSLESQVSMHRMPLYRCLHVCIHRLSMYRCVTSVKNLSHGRHLPIASVARVIIRHLVTRLAFKNAFNNFKHSTLIV